MLTDEQLEILGAELVPLYQLLERETINDIARRLAKTGRLTETAEIMAEALRRKGYSPTRIRAEVMRVIRADKKLQNQIDADTLAYKQKLKTSIEELRQNLGRDESSVWEEAGNMAFHNDLSVWEGEAKPVKGSAFEAMVKAMKKQAGSDLRDLTKSMGFKTPTGITSARKAYTDELNRAFVKLSSGAYSWGQCVEDAVTELSRSGLRTVDYESGVTRQIDTAVRTSVMTASAQLSGQISMQNAENGDAEYVEVSSHWGARDGEGHANHAGWQGKVYKIHGSDPDYPNLEEVTGYPSDPAGLLGYNCRHTFYPFWPGLSEPTEWPPEPEPVTVDGREYNYYQATQEQRKREREIRALKREQSALEAAGMKDKAKEMQQLIRQKSQEYRDFSENVGIRAKNERLRVCEVLTYREKERIIQTKIDDPSITPPPMDRARYERIKTALGRKGIHVISAAGDDLAFLEYMGAEAMALDTDTILHKGEVPTASAMFEETIHIYQNRKLGVADGGDFVERTRREIEANRKVLKHSNEYGLTEEDKKEIEGNLEKWEDDYERRTGARYEG